MADQFEGYSPTLISPASSAAAVTPGASALANTARALYVGGAGDLEVTMLGGQTVIFSSVPAGSIIAVRATHVLNANTTASGIVALW